MKVPQCVLTKIDELNALCEENPEYIPLPKVAAFLGANAEGLRFSIENGKCPFGIMWQKTLTGNKAFKIPTAKFYWWYAGDCVRAVSSLDDLKPNNLHSIAETR